jgi:hypothetical protein
MVKKILSSQTLLQACEQFLSSQASFSIILTRLHAVKTHPPLYLVCCVHETNCKSDGGTTHRR